MQKQSIGLNLRSLFSLRLLLALVLLGSLLSPTANASQKIAIGSPCKKMGDAADLIVKKRSVRVICVREEIGLRWRAMKSNGAGQSNATSNSGQKNHKFLNTACSRSSDGKFKSKITDLETLEVIVPSGVAAGYEIKPHSYIRIKGDRAAVYAPIDMDLVQGALYKEPVTFQAKTTYILHFAVGCEYAMFLDHITDPVDRIKNALNKVPNEDTRLDFFMKKPISFKAGDLIGYTIGAGPANSIRQWDFGYYSAFVTNKYVNQERRIRSYAWKQLHAVCGFDYFPEPLKSTYFGYFATHRGVLVPGAPCRKPNRDVPGTLSGSWFFRSDSSSVEPHVAIASDLDGKTVIIAGLDRYVSIEPANATAKDPATITDKHCFYDPDLDSYFFFVLIDKNSLDFFRGTGQCPSTPIGTKLRLYR